MRFPDIGSQITPRVQVVALFGTQWHMLRAVFVPSVMLCSSGSIRALEKHKVLSRMHARLQARSARDPVNIHII